MRYIAITAALCGCLLAHAAPALAKVGGVGWQTPDTENVPAGTTDFFWHIACPKGFSVVNGAAFAVSQATVANGFILTGAGPRLDEQPPSYAEWAWNWEWPNGGAPSGSQVVMNIYCKKGAP